MAPFVVSAPLPSVFRPVVCSSLCAAASSALCPAASSALCPAASSALCAAASSALCPAASSALCPAASSALCPAASPALCPAASSALTCSRLLSLALTLRLQFQTCLLVQSIECPAPTRAPEPVPQAHSSVQRSIVSTPGPPPNLPPHLRENLRCRCRCQQRRSVLLCLSPALIRGPTLHPSRPPLPLQLHQNLCRQRTLVAIGTHDLSTISGPFSYEALPPQEISFVPLKQTRAFQADELLQHYLDTDRQNLGKFVPIIKDSVVYPVIFDAKRTVLSLPPIINGAHSAISLATRDVFIECTATDLTKAKVVLNTVVTMFSEYAETPFEVEPVEVVDAFGKTLIYPNLASRKIDVGVDYINATLGTGLAPTEVQSLLRKMSLFGELSADGARLALDVPPTRSDVLHACDVMEDVGIAYGYNNIERKIPATVTEGRELPINQLTELLRQECAAAGFTEILTWALTSRAENFDQLRRTDDGATAVEIGNPATAEFEVCRSTLLSSALKTLGANKDAPLPVKLFEVSDVVLLSGDHHVGARNERRLVVVVCNKESGFEVVHGMLNRVMEVLGVPYKGADPALEAKAGGTYSWQEAADAAYFPGRQAKVVAFGKDVGHFGVVHPEVLTAFEITYPVSALELNLEPFCFDQFYRPMM
eukprot:354441-Chlamydomonas_euryale.AAC.2